MLSLLTLIPDTLFLALSGPKPTKWGKYLEIYREAF